MSEIELRDAILRNALQLQRLSANDEASALVILRELEHELRRLLATADLNEAGKRQVKALIDAADGAINARFDTIADVVDVRGIIVYVAEHTAEALAAAIPANSALTQERLASLAKDVLIDGSPAKAWWARQAEDTTFRFAAAVRQGVINGETQERIVARIVGEEGFMLTTRRNVRSLVHSSVMTAANTARLATYRNNADHIAGVKWLATLDSHTCVQCAALDGAEWTLDGEPLGATTLAFRSPPAHFACRCVHTPIPASLEDVLPGFDAALAAVSQRASSNGPVAGDTTFASFLKRQSPAFIDDVLGKRRADLFLAGKITLSDLVSGTGRPLTLQELRP